MSKSTRLLFVLSDPHCGSSYGLLPPGFVTLEGNEQGQNAVQRWLWKCWQDATQVWMPRVSRGDRYAVVMNGDLTEGVHHRSTEVISTDLGDHLEAAIQVLQPVAAAAAAAYVVEGTPCHTLNLEHAIAKAIKAKPCSSTGRPAWGRLDLTIAGTRAIFQHHVATAMRPYLEASGLGIALGVEQLEAAKAGEAIPKVLGVAHRHRYGEFRDASGLCVVSPPWQGLTRFGRKVVPSARTAVGMMALDWRGLPDGSLPHVHSMIYRTPEPKGASL